MARVGALAVHRLEVLGKLVLGTGLNALIKVAFSPLCRCEVQRFVTEGRGFKSLTRHQFFQSLSGEWLTLAKSRVNLGVYSDIALRVLAQHRQVRRNRPRRVVRQAHEDGTAFAAGDVANEVRRFTSNSSSIP